MDHVELIEITEPNMIQTPDLRPYYDPENSVRTACSKIFSPEDLKRLKYIDFPGVANCITAVIYSSEEDDIFCFHVQQDEKPDEINQKIKHFLDNPKYKGKTWTLDYLVRQNPKLILLDPAGNKNNQDNLADVEDNFPGKFNKVNIVYVEADKLASSIGWNHQNHFMKVVYTPESQNL